MEMIQSWIELSKISPKYSPALFKAVVGALVLLLSVASYYIVKKLPLKLLAKSAKTSKNHWDDLFVEHKVFQYAALFVPLVIILYAVPEIFYDNDFISTLITRFVYISMVVAGTIVINSFINALYSIYSTLQIAKEIPIKGFVQGLKILLFFFATLVVISLVIRKTPLYLLSGLGAMTAVMMLIFKDSLLGFIAGIQLTANKMLRQGDWIEMSKYGADGDVEDITLTTIKVRNWDKTITTIPTYALISESFKNWRGMRESGGRRIKRSVYIDINSVKFCTPEMLDRFMKIQYIKDYLQKRNQEITEHNRSLGLDDNCVVNGRRLTNIGTLRAYLEIYLHNNPYINQDMIIMVRQLEPTSCGLPLEVYAFSKDKTWINYEKIQADIFDHILAIIPEFDLKVFQNPTGSDFITCINSRGQNFFELSTNQS